MTGTTGLRRRASVVRDVLPLRLCDKVAESLVSMRCQAVDFLLDLTASPAPRGPPQAIYRALPRDMGARMQKAPADLGRGFYASNCSAHRREERIVHVDEELLAARRDADPYRTQTDQVVQCVVETIAVAHRPITEQTVLGKP